MMEIIDKYILTTSTNWCGESLEYGVVVKKGQDPELIEGFADLCEERASDTFIDFEGEDGVLEELFPDVDDYTDEQRAEAYDVINDYYGWSIEPFDESTGDDFGWFNLFYVQEGVEYE